MSWLLIYEHRFGADHWVCPTEDDAYRMAAFLVTEYVLEEVTEPARQREILQLVLDGKYREAAQQYTSDVTETFEIVERVEGRDVIDVDTLRALAMKKLEKWKESEAP